MKLTKPRESILGVPPPLLDNSRSGPTSTLSWASTPLLKLLRTKFQSYKSSSIKFVSENLRPGEIKSCLNRFKITYTQLHRHSSLWVPTIPAWTLPYRLTFTLDVCLRLEIRRTRLPTVSSPSKSWSYDTLIILPITSLLAPIACKPLPI